MSAVYIHYGHPEYHEELVGYAKPRAVPLRSKPESGLWASRKDAQYGWIDWCRSQAFDDEEEFGYGNFDSHFEFTLSDSAKILEIHEEDDILPYIIKQGHNVCPWVKTDVCDGIDFTKLIAEGYDGVELFISDDYSMHDGIFNLWDCDSIVVWNSEVINLIENKEE